MSVAVQAAQGPARVAVPTNRFHIGDCLPVLAELVAKHGAFADLVYLDPPFNSARLYNHAFRGTRVTLPQKVAFRDTWKWTDKTKRHFDQFTEEEAPGTPAAELLKGMRAVLEKRDGATLAYLAYMTRRLARIRAVMKPTASIYLHCDPTASHYIKMAMDALFGRDNFANEIVWWYKGNSEPKKCFPRKHDILLYYARPGAPFHRVAIPYAPATLRRYNHVDEQGRRYKVSALRDGKQEVVYMKDGKAADDVWEIPVVRTDERLGYATQKPVSLLKRIIAASSNPGDLVLDPFCGCGTTIAACHELGRRFVGVDIGRVAADVIEMRMKEKYSDFGDLRIAKMQASADAWGKVLPEQDEEDEVPEWATFQFAAIKAIPKARQGNGDAVRMGPDGGIDGWLPIERPDTKTLDSIVIQVKRKKQPSVADVADTIAAVDNNNAFMGLLITLNPPTAEMRKRAEAKSAGKLDGKHYPKVAILTYEQVKAGEYAQAIPHHLAVDVQVGGQRRLGLTNS